MPNVFAQEALAKFTEQYAKVTKEGPAYPYDVPVIARLVDAHCDMSSTGKEMIKEKWTILEGEYAGTTISLNQFPFSHPISLGRWKMWAYVLGGFADAAIADIEEIVASIANAEPCAKIRLKQSGAFINYDLIERVDSAEVPASPKTRAVPAAKPSVQKEADEPPADDGDEQFPVGTVVEFEATFGDNPEPQTIQGTITGSDDKGYKATYDDGTEPLWEFSELTTDDLTAVKADDAAQIPEALLALAEAVGEKAEDGDDAAAVAEKLKGYAWKEADLTESEVKTLEDAGVEVQRTPKPKPKAVVKAKPAVKAKVAAAKPKAKAARRK